MYECFIADLLESTNEIEGNLIITIYGYGQRDDSKKKYRQQIFCICSIYLIHSVYNNLHDLTKILFKDCMKL